MTSKQVTSPPWKSRRLVHSKEMVWASRWSVALRAFYRQILSLTYSFFSLKLPPPACPGTTHCLRLWPCCGRTLPRSSVNTNTNTTKNRYGLVPRNRRLCEAQQYQQSCRSQTFPKHPIKSKLPDSKCETGDSDRLLFAPPMIQNLDLHHWRSWPSELKIHFWPSSTVLQPSQGTPDRRQSQSNPSQTDFVCAGPLQTHIRAWLLPHSC